MWRFWSQLWDSNLSCRSVSTRGLRRCGSVQSTIRLLSGSTSSNNSLPNSLRPYLKYLVNKHDKLVEQIAQEKINQEEYQRKFRDLSDLEAIVSLVRQLEKTKEDLYANQSLLSDSQLKNEAKLEIVECQKQINHLGNMIVKQLIPRDQADLNSAMVEVRAGVGGQEASLFAADVFHMYERYAQYKGWLYETLSIVSSRTGGYMNASASINGQGVFGILKFESGSHRVQRIPVTETQGRVHTSTATVAVLPQPSEIDVDIKPSDLKIDTFKASGAGGQHVNTTDSAVRITHLPTGIVVNMQEERSQHRNKDKAMRVLTARIYDVKRKQLEEERSEQRKQQIGTGERHERIRTYNFPQDRVTDHRVGYTVYGVSEFLTGTRLLDEMIVELREQSEHLAIKRLVEEHNYKLDQQH